MIVFGLGEVWARSGRPSPTGVPPAQNRAGTVEARVTTQRPLREPGPPNGQYSPYSRTGNARPMTNPSAWDEAIAAATSSNVRDAINASVVNPVEQAIVERVDLATLHEVDEALSMPEVGGVSRATQPIADVVEQAVRDAWT